jgi:hypothetical protein
MHSSGGNAGSKEERLCYDNGGELWLISVSARRVIRWVVVPILQAWIIDWSVVSGFTTLVLPQCTVDLVAG